jgi:two-component system, NarL family, sensor kinase
VSPARSRSTTEELAPRLVGALRIAAVVIFGAGEGISVRSDLDQRTFGVLLIAFAVYAIALFLRPALGRSDVLVAGIDVGFAAALAFASGGGGSNVRFALIFAPIATALRRRPLLTLGVTVVAVVLYVAQAEVHQRGGREVADSFLAVQSSYIAWLGAAATVLAYLLARREEEVERLLFARQQLVSEALSAEERERQRIAETIHDDALQHLLAVRFDLEADAERDPEGGAAHALEAISETAMRLRRTMSELHPHLLERVGLAGALGSAAELIEQRAGFELVSEIRLTPQGGNEPLLLRGAVELLQNAAKHADASVVTMTIETVGAFDVLTVADDGRGFEPAIIEERLLEGHIGLFSLQERAAALGGHCEIAARRGAGATIVLRLPRRSP